MSIAKHDASRPSRHAEDAGNSSEGQGHRCPSGKIDGPGTWKEAQSHLNPGHLFFAKLI